MEILQTNKKGPRDLVFYARDLISHLSEGENPSLKKTDETLTAKHHTTQKQPATSSPTNPLLRQSNPHTPSSMGSSSTASIMAASQQQHQDDGGSIPRRRRAQEEVPIPQCLFSRNLNTTLAPDNAQPFQGVIFNIQNNNEEIEIVGFEIDTGGQDAGVVQIYAKPDGYGNFYADPSAWTQVTIPGARAVPSPEGRTAIVQSSQIQAPIKLLAKESRSIYVSMESPVIRSADTGLAKNNMLAQDSEVTVSVGSALSGPLWSDSLTDNRQFNGVLYYRTTTACREPRTRFKMEMPYFVDQMAAEQLIVSITNNAISAAIDKGLSLNANLVRMHNFGGLQKIGVETVVEDYNDLCPFQFQACTKLVSTIEFSHDFNTDSGLVNYEILKYADKIDVGDAPFLLGYAGKMPLTLDYFVSLVGAPKDYALDSVQKSYYGQETTKFLKDSTGEEILAAGITKERQTSPTRRGRSLQTSDAKLHTTIYGAYPAWPEPQTYNATRSVDGTATLETLRTAFGDQGAIYARYLSGSVARPGAINEEGRADFFKGISNVIADFDEKSMWMPTVAPTMAPTMDPNQEPTVGGIPVTVLIVLGVIFMVIGACLLVFSIYWDCQQRKMNKEKLKRHARSAQRKVDMLRAEQYRRIAAAKKGAPPKGDASEQPLIT